MPTKVKETKPEKKYSVAELIKALETVNDPEEKAKTICPGSGKPVNRHGSRYVNYSLKYRCPACAGFYAKTNDGKINKHQSNKTEKRKTEKQILALLKAQGIAQGFCAGCSKMQPMEEGDFLCVHCRAE